MEPDPTDHLTIVGQGEFDMLCLLPDYERHGDSLIRTEGDHVFVTMLQSAYDHMAALTAEVEDECVVVTESAEPIIEISPPQLQKPELNIPAIDRDRWEKSGMDKPPVPTGENNRPPDRRFGGLIDF
jgi:hypothetical protein